MVGTGARILGLSLACMAGCAHATKPAAQPVAKSASEAKVRAPRKPPPAEWFWEAVDADIHAPPRKPIALPVAESAIAKSDGAAKVWNELAPEARERLRRDGLVVVGNESETLTKGALSFGAFYSELADQKVPQLVTVDALYAAARLGLEAALAQAEDVLMPVLDTLLLRLEARLNTEARGAGATLTEAYRLARGVVTVARVLAADTKDAKPPIAPDLAALVAAERALVEAHAVVAPSPILGVPLDYTRFAAPSGAVRPGSFRALAWLGSAPFALAARAEHPGAPLDVAQTRASTRAAMLLARLCDSDIDATSHALYTRIQRYLAFVWGPSDDLTLLELDEIGTKAGVDLTKPEHILNVAKVDRVRAGARAHGAPSVHDGAGGAGRTARIFGGHASPDAVALSALLGPFAAQPEAPPSLQRSGIRVVPTTLDVAAWLDAPGAKLALHDTHADAFDGFDAALGKLVESRDPDTFHATLYGSLLAAVAALAPMPAATPALERVRLESLLSAWTQIRHIDQPFARRSVPHGPAPAGSTTAPVFVEAAPEAIASLAGAVQQARRGLEAVAGVKSPALDDVEDLLRLALKAAEHEVNDEAAVDASSILTRIAKLEEEAGDPGPLAAVIAADPPSRRVLVSATGRLEPLLVLFREAGKDEPMLVVGAHLAHHEIVTDAGESPVDATWRAKAASAARAAYTSTFRFLPPSRVSP